MLAPWKIDRSAQRARAIRMVRLSDVSRRMAICLVRGYQYFFSPFFGQHCRFHPTCSSYAIEALGRFGLLRGGALALRRLARCHPWCAGGLDLVPTTQDEPQQHDRGGARC